MIDSAEKRGQLIRHLEDALALAEQLDDGMTEYLIERALDEARSRQFRPATTDKSTRERTPHSRSRRRQAAATQVASLPVADRAREAEIAKRGMQLIAHLATSTEKQRLEHWLRRPRLPSAIFASVWRDNKRAELGEVIVGDSRQNEIAADRMRSVKKIAKSVGWSDERLTLFTQLVAEYRENRSIENYLRITREFPEVEIEVDHFVEFGFLALKHIEQKGIEPDLILAAWYCGAPLVDVLSLRLLELRAARDELPKGGPGHIQRRRDAINDATINYLITTMLERLASGETKFQIPASLVALIRHQLCGESPDLHTMCLAESKRNSMAIAAAKKLKPDERLSINKLVQMTGLKRATAARLLKNDFSRAVALFQNAGKYRSDAEVIKLLNS
jgi:hypothetical protein